MKTQGINKMETVPEGKLLLSLSLPIMLSMMLQAFYHVVDSIFVTRFSEKASSAVSLTFPMQTLMIAISIGTCIGINAFLSRTLGRKDMQKARVIVQHGVLLAVLSYAIFLVLGVFYTRQYFIFQTSDCAIVDYGADYMSICLIGSISLFGQQLFEKLLQATGYSVLSMVSQIAGAVINTVLDPILIFGFIGFPALGIRGAAIATVTGQFAAFVLAVVFHQHYNKALRVSFAHFHFDIDLVKQIYKIGLPAIIMQAIGSIANFLINGILLTFSATATAAFGIYYKLQNFVFMPVYGLTSAMLPIMSYNVGAKKKRRVMGTFRYAMIFMSIVMLTGMVIFEWVPSQILSLFHASQELCSIGVPALRMISLSFIFEGFCLISQTGFQSLGKGITSLVCSFTRQILILLPMTYMLSLGGDVNHIWIAFPITGIIGSIVCLLLWRGVYKRI